MGDNKAIFHFSHKEDLDKVLLLDLWSFDKYLLILHKLDAGEAATKVEFNRATFWANPWAPYRVSDERCKISD